MDLTWTKSQYYLLAISARFEKSRKLVKIKGHKTRNKKWRRPGTVAVNASQMREDFGGSVITERL